MKFLRINNKLLIMNGRDPLQHVDLTSKTLYTYKGIYVDEIAHWPILKWWRNPVKWWQWRRITKGVSRHTKITFQTTPISPNPFGDSKINLRRDRNARK